MRPPLRQFLFILGKSTVHIIAADPVSAGKILLRWDFENETPFHDLKIEGEPPTVIADPLDPRNHVMKAILLPHAKREERSEVRWDRLPVGVERWVGFRIFRPNLNQMGYTCYFQLGPISGGTSPGGGLFHITGTGTSSQLHWQIIGFLQRTGGTSIHQAVGTPVAGRWEQWVQHLRLRSDQDGVLEVWRDGTQVATLRGKNALEHDRIPIKWGVYVGKGNASEVEITALYDDIVVGDERCRYQDVISPRPASP